MAAVITPRPSQWGNRDPGLFHFPRNQLLGDTRLLELGILVPIISSTRLALLLQREASSSRQLQKEPAKSPHPPAWPTCQYRMALQPASSKGSLIDAMCPVTHVPVRSTAPTHTRLPRIEIVFSPIPSCAPQNRQVGVKIGGHNTGSAISAGALLKVQWRP